MPVAAPHPTSDALIGAGLRLAERIGLSTMTVDAVVAEAGVAKGTFYVHFGDRAAYLVELHRQFHDQLRDRIDTATDGIDHGPERLRAGAVAYLDGCLKSRGVKAILQEARSEPTIRQAVQRSDVRFARDAELCFQAMGASEAGAAARLFVAMCAEAAIAELEAGRKRRDMRRTVNRFAGIDRDGR